MSTYLQRVISSLSTPVRTDPTNETATQITHGKTIKSVTGSTSATATIIAAVPAKAIKVFAVEVRTAYTSLITATFNDGPGGTAKWAEAMQAPAGVLFGSNIAVSVPSYLFRTTAGSALELALSTGQTVYYNISYFDDDAA